MPPYASILLKVDHVGSVLPMILLLGCGTTGTRLNCRVSRSPAVGFTSIRWKTSTAIGLIGMLATNVTHICGSLASELQHMCQTICHT